VNKQVQDKGQIERK